MIRIFILKMRLRYYGIKEYIINDDMSIDVNGNVNLSNKRLRKIPFDFRNVYGNFNIANNKLKSLKGSPKLVDNFYCGSNRLTSLKYSPELVNGGFDCSYNRLTSLEGCPEVINDIFNFDVNIVTTFTGGPKTVNTSGEFFAISCRGNRISDLYNLPKIGNERFIRMDSNPIFDIYYILKNKNGLIDIFNFYDIIRDNKIITYRLNAFLEENDEEMNIDECCKYYKLVD